MIIRNDARRRPPFVWALVLVAVVGLSSACSSGSSGGVSDVTSPAAGASAAKSSSGSGGGGGASLGQVDLDSVCPKLPVADAQKLIRTTLGAAVRDDRLGGCTFVLPGNDIADNNLTVGVEVGNNAAKRYSDDQTGTFSAGGASVSTGGGITTALSGVGDKAVWGSTVGYPTISALKGNVYCTVLTADDATQLTIIGGPNNPLPQGSSDQQLQYAQLEGALCNDLFALVH